METMSQRNSQAMSYPGLCWPPLPGFCPTDTTTATATTLDASSMKSSQDLIEAARANAPGLAELMTRHLPGLQLAGAAAVPATDTAPMRGSGTGGRHSAGAEVSSAGSASSRRPSNDSSPPGRKIISTISSSPKASSR
jgi:hypothetical protein